MRITRASDHTVTGLSDLRYCTMADVQHLVGNMERDSVDTPLAALLSGGEQNTLLTMMIINARYWVESPQQANHDFEHHEDVAVYLDGTGSNSVNLAPAGFAPLLSITNLEIDGDAADEDDDYTYNSRGVLRKVSDVSHEVYKYGSGDYPLFTRGTQNITATISWGYESYPEDIKYAQALKVVSDLMAYIDRSDTEDGNLPGGVSQLRFGNDLVVQVGSDGRYARMRKELQRQAREICLRYRITLAIGTNPF